MIKRSKDMTLEEKTDALISRTGAILVTDQSSLEDANRFLLVLKSLEREIAATFDPIIKKAHEAHRAALDAKKKHIEPVIKAKKLLGSQVAVYVTEQDRIRQEAEAKAAAEAAEAERIRQEAIDEAAWEKFQAEEEGDKEKVKELEKAEKQGGIEEHDFFAKPAAEAAIPEAPEMHGIHTRTTWRFKVTNELIVPRTYLMLDHSLIGSTVRRLKDKTAIPGIETYPDTTTVV